MSGVWLESRTAPPRQPTLTDDGVCCLLMFHLPFRASAMPWSTPLVCLASWAFLSQQTMMQQGDHCWRSVPRHHSTQSSSLAIRCVSSVVVFVRQQQAAALLPLHTLPTQHTLPAHTHTHFYSPSHRVVVTWHINACGLHREGSFASLYNGNGAQYNNKIIFAHRCHFLPTTELYTLGHSHTSHTIYTPFHV